MDDFPSGEIGTTRLHRQWASLSLNQEVRVDVFDTSRDNNCFLSRMEVQVIQFVSLLPLLFIEFGIILLAT